MKLLVTGRRDFADKERIVVEIDNLAPTFVVHYDAATTKLARKVLVAEAPDKVLTFAVGNAVAAAARELGIDLVEVVA